MGRALSANDLREASPEMARDMAERSVERALESIPKGRNESEVLPRVSNDKVKVYDKGNPAQAPKKDVNESLIAAENAAIKLGLRAEDIHQMKDGTWMPGKTHEEYERFIRDAQVREEQDEIIDARDARSVRDIAIETLTRDATGRGRSVVVTGKSATMISREVSSASSVEVLITGVESGAQKRITVNITPGTSLINRPINGKKNPLTKRKKSKSKGLGNMKVNKSAVQSRARAAVKTQEKQSGELTRGDAAEILKNEIERTGGRGMSAESIRGALSR